MSYLFSSKCFKHGDWTSRFNCCPMCEKDAQKGHEAHQFPQIGGPAPCGKEYRPVPGMTATEAAALSHRTGISIEDLLKLRKRLFAKLDEVLVAKGNDYNAQQQLAGDTLFNIRVCSIMGIVPSPVDGLLVRLSDKLMRLVSLTRPNVQQKVKDESIEDTIGDAINYLTYLLAMWQESKGKSVE